MSEFLKYNDGNEPYLPFRIKNKDFNLTRDDLHVYRFAPVYAEVSHLYIIQEKRNRTIGGYIFRASLGEFDAIADELESEFFWTIRGPKPSEQDLNIYAKFEAGREESPDWLE